MSGMTSTSLIMWLTQTNMVTWLSICVTFKVWTPWSQTQHTTVGKVSYSKQRWPQSRHHELTKIQPIRTFDLNLVQSPPSVTLFVSTHDHILIKKKRKTLISGSWFFAPHQTCSLTVVIHNKTISLTKTRVLKFVIKTKTEIKSTRDFIRKRTKTLIG